jgi:hypothetical protein
MALKTGVCGGIIKFAGCHPNYLEQRSPGSELKWLVPGDNTD